MILIGSLICLAVFSWCIGYVIGIRKMVSMMEDNSKESVRFFPREGDMPVKVVQNDWFIRSRAIDDYKLYLYHPRMWVEKQERNEKILIAFSTLLFPLSAILGIILPFWAIKASIDPIRYHCPIVVFQMKTAELVGLSLLSGLFCIFIFCFFSVVAFKVIKGLRR